MKSNRVCIVFALFIFMGCSELTIEEYVDSGKGLSIEVLREIYSRPNSYNAYQTKIGWKETTYTLDNGNWVYVELIREARKDYYIHWEVNKSGIIIGSSIEETARRPEKQKSP
jgi:hypothetical protein